MLTPRTAVVGCLGVCLLVACHHRQPKMTDAQIEQFRRDNPGITNECVEKIRWGGIEAMPNQVDKCFKMTPQRRWTGLWRNDYEGSRFCPAPAHECTCKTAGETIWLDARVGLGVSKSPPGGLYAVDFLGRKTAYPGRYSSMADQEIIVDRLMSIKEVEPPPPQPTKAQMDAWEKQCEAAHQCIPVEKLKWMGNREVETNRH